jgi:hypothetical protein
VARQGRAGQGGRGQGLVGQGAGGGQVRAGGRGPIRVGQGVRENGRPDRAGQGRVGQGQARGQGAGHCGQGKGTHGGLHSGLRPRAPTSFHRLRQFNKMVVGTSGFYFSIICFLNLGNFSHFGNYFFSNLRNFKKKILFFIFI